MAQLNYFIDIILLQLASHLETKDVPIILLTHFVVTISPQVAAFIGERSGSMVECSTQDRGAAGSSLTGVTVVVLEQDTFILA